VAVGEGRIQWLCSCHFLPNYEIRLKVVQLRICVALIQISELVYTHSRRLEFSPRVSSPQSHILSNPTSAPSRSWPITSDQGEAE
jgi:hypothetical protein